MVHVVATVGCLLGSYGVIGVGDYARLGTGLVFFLVGFQATITYNLLLLLETTAGRVIMEAMESA